MTTFKQAENYSKEISKMSVSHHESILETCYDEAWIDYMVANNLTQDQLFAIEQDSEHGILPEIEAEARRRFEDLCQ